MSDLIPPRYPNMPLARVEAALHISPTELAFDEILRFREALRSSYPIVEQAPSFGNQVQFGPSVPLHQGNHSNGTYVAVSGSEVRAGWARLHERRDYPGHLQIFENLQSAVQVLANNPEFKGVILTYIVEWPLEDEENAWDLFADNVFPERLKGPVVTDQISAQYITDGSLSYRYDLVSDHQWFRIQTTGALGTDASGGDWLTTLKTVHDNMSQALDGLLSAKGKLKFS